MRQSRAPSGRWATTTSRCPPGYTFTSTRGSLSRRPHTCQARAVITEDDIYAELGKIVAGYKEGHISPDETTLFKAIGLAILDVGTVYKFYQLAKEKGIGATLAG